VLESGDTLPHEYAVEHMVRMFRDPNVGMVGAQKMAVNTPDHIVGLLSHMRLRMEHELCLEIPRLGEMIAFRKVFEQIPPDVAMDEAFVEAIVVRQGMQVRYAPDAIVYNTGPTPSVILSASDGATTPDISTSSTNMATR
jgi:biofilm PGA synthesis N-glycosyltransferase PgaC